MGSVDGSSQASVGERQSKRGIGAAVGNRLTSTVTPDGIDIWDVLEKQNEVINQIDMRLRYVENSSYLTFKMPPDHNWIVEGCAGSKHHNELVTDSRAKGLSKEDKKKIGGPSLYVAFGWLRIIINMAQTAPPTGPGTEQLQNAISRCKTIHDMGYIFSHSQCWITKDRKVGYMKFKLQPWMRDVETWLAFTLLLDPMITLEDQPTAAGPKLWVMNQAMGLEGNGRKR